MSKIRSTNLAISHASGIKNNLGKSFWPCDLGLRVKRVRLRMFKSLWEISGNISLGHLKKSMLCKNADQDGSF